MTPVAASCRNRIMTLRDYFLSGTFVPPPVLEPASGAVLAGAAAGFDGSDFLVAAVESAQPETKATAAQIESTQANLRANVIVLNLSDFLPTG
jgi:hypothetical protein